ncbi:NAD(P)-binding protein [Parathielavia appendiculata]|uniref:NAD(P)-binding protein n=1 Tax=Parathielavia appendiculata TaxID=2587402 RepID=A0AAN6TS29_9PEZI|nr:NAD(P)-binding protein [Parathielavia appendiculata]
MPSYVITGVSGVLGFEFLRQISQYPSNTVIGLVRDKASTEKKVSEQLGGRSNIHILQADLSNYEAMKRSVGETDAITGGTLDYLIANAGYVSTWDSYDPIGVLGNDPAKLEEEMLRCFKINVVGNVHLFNIFMPLILKGQVKKVVAISSGTSDLDPVRQHDMAVFSAYATSKAALNFVVAKFSAQYRKDGVLFMSICPGLVEAGHYTNLTQEQQRKLESVFAQFTEYAPHFSGPARPEDAVRDVISVLERASVENGDGGSFVSHLGNKQWL